MKRNSKLSVTTVTAAWDNVRNTARQHGFAQASRPCSCVLRLAHPAFPQLLKQLLRQLSSNVNVVAARNGSLCGLGRGRQWDEIILVLESVFPTKLVPNLLWQIWRNLKSNKKQALLDYLEEGFQLTALVRWVYKCWLAVAHVAS